MEIGKRKESAKYLRVGDYRKICDMAGVHINIIYRYVSGELKNSTVEIYFEKLVEKRKAELTQKMNQID